MGLTPINIDYGLSPEDVLKRKLTNISNAQQPSSTGDYLFDLLGKLNSTSTIDEFRSLFSSMMMNINYNDIPIATLLSILDGAISIVDTRKYYDKDIINTLESTYSTLIEKYIKDGSNPLMSNIVNNTGKAINRIKFHMSGIYDEDPICTESIYIYNIGKESTITEGTIIDTDSHKIYSDSHPTGTRVMGRSPYPESDGKDEVKTMVCSDTDEEFMNRINSVKIYFNSCKTDFSDKNYDYLVFVMNHIYDRLVANNTGLDVFANTIETMMNMCTSVNSMDSAGLVSDNSSIINKFYMYLFDMSNRIRNRISKNETDDEISVKTDLLTELGLGFLNLYSSENMTQTEAIEIINSMNEIGDSDSYVTALNEFLDLNALDRKERNDAKRTHKEAMRQQRAENDENYRVSQRDLKLRAKEQRMQRKEAARDRKEQLKTQRAEHNEQMRQQRAEQKNQIRMNRTERKEQDKDAKSEQRKRDKDALLYSIKTKYLTSSGFRGVINGIKKCIAALGVGAGAAAIGGSGLGLFLGLSSLLALGLGSKMVPTNDKRKCLMEIKSELEIIDNKLAEADRNDDEKTRAKLIKIKTKLEEIYNRNQGIW